MPQHAAAQEIFPRDRTCLPTPHPRLQEPPSDVPAPYITIFAVHDLVHMFLFHGAAAVLTVFAGDGAVLRKSAFTSAQLQLHRVRGSALWRERDNQTTLYVAGAWGAEWQLTALPLLGPAAPTPLRNALAPLLPLCAAAPCAVAGAVAVHEGTAFLALEQAAGLVVAKIDLASRSVARHASVDGIGAAPAVSALTVDPKTLAVFVAANVEGRPSVVYKINSTTLAPYGIHRMRNRGGAPPPPARTSQCWSRQIPHGLGVCIWMHCAGNSPSLGRPTPGVVKQDKSSGGSVDTTKTRSGPQRVRMSSGERPIGAAKGKQSDTEALCHPPPPPPRTSQCWSRQTPAWTRSVHLDAPGQRCRQQPVSGTADPRSSQTGQVIRGLR